jgi:thioredoxin reductase (NADPH)
MLSGACLTVGDFSFQGQTMDCLIIGGGPAGLTAAIYLARFKRQVALIDAGDSRARLIPKSHNYPGFTDGVTGERLLELLRQQADTYGVMRIEGRVERLDKTDNGFSAHWDGRQLAAKRVIVATGLIDKCPPVPRLRQAIAEGLVRYCPICDGFEASGQRIAILGHAEEAFGKAIFLRTYSDAVTLLTLDGSKPDEKARSELDQAAIVRPSASVSSIEHGQGILTVRLTDGGVLHFDTLYPVLGCEVRSELATALGVPQNEVSCLIVDKYQETAVPGLYAIGDVVSDLHQIAVGIGHAAVAATHLHRQLPPNLKF